MTATATKPAAATKVVTGKVRLSYVHVFEPFTNIENAEPRYSAVILIPKTDKKTYEALRAAQQLALEQGKTSKFGGKIPATWKDTIRDGDEEGDFEKNPEYKDHWFLNASSKTKPGIVDTNVQPITDSTEVYSGCYARVSLNAFPFNRQGNRGVSFGLNHIQKLADGDYLGGRSRAEDDFDAVETAENAEDSLL